MLEPGDPFLDSLVQDLDDLHTGPFLLLTRHDVPWRELVVGAGEHLIDRLLVLLDLVAIAPVLVGELPATDGVLLPVLESAQLLLRTDLQPELDDDHALEHERAFELNDLLVCALPLFWGGVALDPFDEHASVPRTIEQRHPTETGHLLPEPPQEVLAFLVEARLGERRDAVVARVERLDDAFDRTTFAARIRSLEHHQHAWPDLRRVEAPADVEPQLEQLALGRIDACVVLVVGQPRG